MKTHSSLAPGRMPSALLAAALALLTINGLLRGQQSFGVSNTEDSGPGSLRDAILNANLVPGADRIEFNVPGPGPHTIFLLSQLPVIDDPLTVDGTTQPGYAGRPIIELSGAQAGPNVSGLLFQTFNGVVRGLAINSFLNGNGIELVDGGNHVIQGNYIGTDITGTVALSNSWSGILVLNSVNNRIGGTNLAARNLIAGNSQHGVFIYSNSGRNVVQGNLIGTDVTGTNSLGNGLVGVTILEASNNTIGGTNSGARNVISGNGLSGIQLEGNTTAFNLIQGNFMGTDITGTVALGNGEDGIGILGARNNTIGGITPAARNIISANGLFGQPNNGRSGIEVWGGASGTIIQGNFIGTDVSGSANLGNPEYGVYIQNSSGTTVGGTTPGAGNRIWFNQQGGVVVESGTRNFIRGNSIFSNAGFGIDLSLDGVTSNDSNDSDAGANSLQNFPELNSASIASGSITIQGTLHSSANTTFTVDFYSNASLDPTGFGQGQTYVGAAAVSTDESGNGNFTNTLASAVSTSQFITATATDPSNNTSEFCPALAATVAPPPLVTPPIMESGGGLTLNLDVPVGTTYRLQHKDDLNADRWSDDGDFSGPLQVVHSLDRNTAQRFYRIVQLP